MVSENGASIYSASEAAREEFPDYDLTVRGSVSIGRRLMDPLAELVKIDPKSIGVGQYQHDVELAKPGGTPGRSSSPSRLPRVSGRLKAAPKAWKKSDKNKKSLARFANNPFYEAFRKKGRI